MLRARNGPISRLKQARFGRNRAILSLEFSFFTFRFTLSPEKEDQLKSVYILINRPFCACVNGEKKQNTNQKSESKVHSMKAFPETSAWPSFVQANED